MSLARASVVKCFLSRGLAPVKVPGMTPFDSALFDLAVAREAIERLAKVLHVSTAALRNSWPGRGGVLDRQKSVQPCVVNQVCQFVADSPGWPGTMGARVEFRITPLALFHQPLEVLPGQSHGEADVSQPGSAHLHDLKVSRDASRSARAQRV